MNQQNKPAALAVLILFLSAAGGLLVFSSCKGADHSGPTIVSIADIGANKPPPQKAFLVLAGQRFSVDVVTEEIGDEWIIKLMSFNEEIEREKYKLDPTSFSLLEAGGETYDPPLPLLQFPMEIGRGWTWSGDLMFAAERHKTDAKVTTTGERLNVQGFNDEAIRVKVDLSIESGGPKPAERTLSFWFVPGKGMLKREFGQASSRIPADVETKEEEKP